MNLELFKLHELPFRLSPDPDFLYLSKQHARAKAYMESTIWFTDGFVVITGEIGAGKTTLIETFLRELQTEVVIAQVNQTQLSPTAFLQTVLVQFGFSPFNMKKPEVLATLNQFLVEQHGSGRKVLLIIDEAQNLSNRVLEEVRLLSGVETTKEKVLRFHLNALSKSETTAYIDHRLEVAGSQGRRIFAEDTYATIFKYTGGVPRLINTLCDTAMMAAFGKNQDTVTAVELADAIGELQWVEFAAGTNRLKIPNLEHSLLSQADSGHSVGRILLASEGKTVLERQLKPGRLVIGRTSDNDLQIDSKFISRHHCQIVTQTDSCLIEDLNSTNGIFVQSKRVRRHNLNDGDVVQVGQHEIMYIDERTPRVRSSVDAVDSEAAENPKPA
jgi:general secretion pathway protein A